MGSKEYNKIVKKVSTKNNKLKNAFISFVAGGLICMFGELITTVIARISGLSNKESIIWMMIILVLLSTLFTCIGFFDEWVTKLKAGLIVPITGFAHSISSAVLDYKKDGLITGIGSNVFKLAGSVIFYGVISGFFFALLKVIIYG